MAVEPSPRIAAFGESLEDVVQMPALRADGFVSKLLPVEGRRDRRARGPRRNTRSRDISITQRYLTCRCLDTSSGLSHFA